MRRPKGILGSMKCTAKYRAEDAVRVQVWERLRTPVWRHVRNLVVEGVKASVRERMGGTNLRGYRCGL